MDFRTALFCEFDKYAAESYCAIHGVAPTLNIGDITQADEKAVSDFNVMFGGSPCQDFSIASKQGAAWTCKHCGHVYNPLEAHYDQRNHCPKQGFIECAVGGVADLSYPSSKTRRGRVQENGWICPTITATETGICRIERMSTFEYRNHEPPRVLQRD